MYLGPLRGTPDADQVDSFLDFQLPSVTLVRDATSNSDWKPPINDQLDSIFNFQLPSISSVGDATRSSDWKQTT